MPPPMPNPSKRITANPIRPARYRPGKAVQEEESSDEEDEEELEQQKRAAARPRSRVQPQKARAPVQEEEDDDDEEGFVTEEEDEAPTATRPQSKPSTQARPVTTTQQTAATTQVSTIAPAVQQESEDEESDEEPEEEESSEAESSSEDEPQRKFQRPTFIKKSERQKPLDPANSTTPNPSTESTGLAAASSTPDLDEQTRRLAQAELYIKDKLERDAIARSQGKKAWDDDDEISPEAMVDDTDDLDPAAEHAAWKLRELKRLKRDREALEAREREIEEIERRRNLTQEERDAEDRAYLEKQKEDRDEGRSKANYLAKYHHKGAFFQDDEMAEVLRKRDIMGAKFEDEISDKSALPEYMRVRDMTKLGKKGRTRYTDLKNEDTGRFGDAVRKWKGAGYANDDGTRNGQDTRGVDERFLPDSGRGRRDTDGPTGANASAVGQRRERRYSRSRSRSRSPERTRDRYRERSRDRGDTYRPRRRSYSSSRSRSRSRSRTPPRRKRSHSPYADRDKRRRVEVD